MFRNVLFLVIILILSSLFVSAQDATELDPEANACAEGGSMEGKCNIDFDGNGTVDDYEILWAWTCGWYIVRYDAGIFAEVPSYCESLLASEPVSEGGGEAETSFCYTYEEGIGYYIWPAGPDGSIQDGALEPSGFSKGLPSGVPPCNEAPA